MSLKTRSFFIFHFPLILYAGFVILFSSIPNLGGPKLKFLALDKIAHFVEYAIFAFLTYRSFSQLPFRKPRTVYLLGFLFLISFAAVDEYYQQYIPGRHSDIWDLLTDLGGASLVLILLAITRRKANKRP